MSQVPPVVLLCSFTSPSPPISISSALFLGSHSFLLHPFNVSVPRYYFRVRLSCLFCFHYCTLACLWSPVTHYFILYCLCRSLLVPSLCGPHMSSIAPSNLLSLFYILHPFVLITLPFTQLSLLSFSSSCLYYLSQLASVFPFVRLWYFLSFSSHRCSTYGRIVSLL